jgi:hypothetical protein
LKGFKRLPDASRHRLHVADDMLHLLFELHSSFVHGSNSVSGIVIDRCTLKARVKKTQISRLKAWRFLAHGLPALCTLVSTFTQVSNVLLLALKHHANMVDVLQSFVHSLLATTIIGRKIALTLTKHFPKTEVLAPQLLQAA